MQRTGIWALPRHVQEDIARRTCPYTVETILDPGHVGLNVYLPGGVVYLRIPPGSSKKLKAFSSRVRKNEESRWRRGSIDTFDVHFPNLTLRYEDGLVFIYITKMISAVIFACPSLMDRLDELAKHL